MSLHDSVSIRPAGMREGQRTLGAMQIRNTRLAGSKRVFRGTALAERRRRIWKLALDIWT